MHPIDGFWRDAKTQGARNSVSRLRHAATSATFAAPAFAATWDALYVFGDSYSDSGAGYADINGPTAVVYLARRLEIPFTHANDPDRGSRRRASRLESLEP